MTKWIVHSIIFLIVAAVVASTFIGVDADDDINVVAQLPALMLAGVYVGVMFVVYILPVITDKATSAVLDSNAIVESDPLQGARAAYARGDYEEAMEVYRNATDDDPYNRLPWVEVAKIQQDKLEDPEAAIDTLRTALESHEWPVEDAAYFMGRIAEIYQHDLDEREAAVTVLQQIIEVFPETRHSANATHRLREMGEA